jgi:hypothetical protein
MHVLLDEIYANSVFDRYTADHEFVSGVQLCTRQGIPQLTARLHSAADGAPSMETAEGKGTEAHAAAPASSADAEASSVPSKSAGLLGPMVHVLWGMAKDFGASGLRVGALYSENSSLNRAFDNLGYFASISNPMQQRVAELLEDLEWVCGYLDESRLGLKACYDTLWRSLQAAGIRSTPASAGLFAWIDLRCLLPPGAGFEDERALHRRLHREARVLLTPGEACHSLAPGFFRCCFAWMPLSVLGAGLQRLVDLAEVIRAELKEASPAASASPPSAAAGTASASDAAATATPASFSRRGSATLQAIRSARRLAEAELDDDMAEVAGSPLAEALAGADHALTRTGSSRDSPDVRRSPSAQALYAGRVRATSREPESPSPEAADPSKSE